MKQQNPLRISQESINLDDIISDLNEGNQRSTTKNSVITHQDSEQKQSTKNGGTKTTLKTKTMMTKQASKAGLSKPGDKENVNKANESKVEVPQKSNQSETGKQKDFLVSTQSQTKTERTNQPSSNLNEDLAMVNDRYGDSNFNFETGSHTNEDHESSTQKTKLANYGSEAPFYLNRGAISSVGSITDEDVEGFQKKLDTLIINFRSETMSEFMRTKKQVLHDQAQTIDAERRRCNTLLGVKQNEIEQLKESLASKTKLSDELSIRCEIMALWAGKGKTLARMKVLQFKCFNALKQYRDFKKHSKAVLKNKLQRYREGVKRRAFLGWEKQYKQWKIVKNKDDFDKAVKQELQHIAAQYSKEIESLRQKLDEANQIVDQENRNKAMMQENLKKAFMRGVCALNFEAMNILNPNDMSMQNQIEREMEKQVMFAMNGIANQSVSSMPSYQTEQQRSPMQPPLQIRSVFSQNENNYTYSQSDFSEAQYSEKKLFQIDHNTDMDYKKVETKDSLWKPAPIMGREIMQETGPTFTYSQPTITSSLRTAQQQQSYVLPSHFNKPGNDSIQTQSLQREDLHVESVRVEANTESRTIQNTQILTSASTLPDFINNTNHKPSEGKTIYANGAQSQQNMGKGVTVTTQGKKTSTITSTVGKKPAK